MPAARQGYTLLEVMLAIALSSVLLGLLTLAVDQFLVNVQSSRDAVEHSQVARGVLRLIANDLRNTAIAYKQDVSAAQAAAEAAAASSFDADTVDDEVPPEDEFGYSQDTATPAGVSGDLTTLQIDVLRTRRPAMPQPEDVATAAPGVTPFEGPPETSGVSTVRYSFEQGRGLLRQEISRDIALWQEQQGLSDAWDQAVQVVAEEVVAIEFRYSDGANAQTVWDLDEQEGVSPVAVEVQVTLREPSRRREANRRDANRREEAPTRRYRMTVALPGVPAVSAAEDTQPGGQTPPQ